MKDCNKESEYEICKDCKQRAWGIVFDVKTKLRNGKLRDLNLLNLEMKRMGFKIKEGRIVII